MFLEVFKNLRNSPSFWRTKPFFLYFFLYFFSFLLSLVTVHTMFFSASLLISFSIAVAAVPTRRDMGSVIWDGRLKADFPLANLDSSATSPFDSQNVLGAGQKWSEQILFPSVAPSMVGSLSTSIPFI